MYNNRVHERSIIVLLVLLLLLQAVTWSDATRAHVRITNMMEGINARIRCLSKHGGGDVAEQDVPYQGLYEFGFTPSILGITKYNCEFVFDNKSQWFQIYNEHREQGVCWRMCWWIIYQTGPCYVYGIDSDINELNGGPYQCFPWNN
ncbi:S-protein homolog 18-like [Chenopodium quinoa]|uniref:S-protein homolog 18-like n=1 Tax=Chenopodium quinoa TaxID=63459 RepID=UPI000B76D998|nr:S-protein homolog 18-like [Chenopodium quinoa]